MSHSEQTKGPDGVPYLMPQPVEGESPIDALQLVNRYGTYEIQPTSESENFFPAIGAGTMEDGRLRQVRRQSKIDASDAAAHQEEKQ